MSLAVLRRKPTQEDPSVLVIPVGELNIDTAYQRDLDIARAEKYAREWDPYLLNELTVSERDDGTYWVIDGAHRLHAALKRGIVNLRCFVVRGLSPEDEAALFVKLNRNRKAVNAWDSFKAALAAKDRDALRIKATVEEAGYSITRSGGPRAIKAVAGLQKINNLGGVELLRETLVVIGVAWEGDPDATENMPLVGIATFLHHYRSHPAYSHARLLEVLSKIPVSRLVREVKALSTDRDGLVTTSTGAMRAALVIRGFYNRGLRTRKLPLPVAANGRTIGAYSE